MRRACGLWLRRVLGLPSFPAHSPMQRGGRCSAPSQAQADHLQMNLIYLPHRVLMRIKEDETAKSEASGTVPDIRQLLSIIHEALPTRNKWKGST